MTKGNVLVTGSAQGLGAGIARRLAEDGWTVAVNDILSDAAISLVKEINGDGLSAVLAIADVTDNNSVTSMVEQIESTVGPLQAVVLSATGPQPDLPLSDIGWAEMAAEIDFFVKSPHIVCQAVLPSMRQQKFGRIVHIDSEVASKLTRSRTNYITAKNAQIGLMKSWALEVAEEGITVNTVAPGFVPVERHVDVTQQLVNAYKSTVPMQRMGTTADIAAAVAFFLSGDAGFITGQRLVVDGGRHLT